MSTWLNVLGLKDSDVVVKQMDQASAVAAFEKGVGDVAVVWAPYCYTAEAKGYKKMSDLQDVPARALPITLIGDKEFCDKNPEVVAKFLRVYLRAVNYMQKTRQQPRSGQDVPEVHEGLGRDEHDAGDVQTGHRRHIRCGPWKSSSNCSTHPRG